MILGKLSKLKVGFTVLIGIAIFVFFVFIVGTESNLFTKTYTLNLFVTDLEGLADGSMVTLGGMKIGQVNKLEFSQMNGINGVIISISMSKKYQMMITEKSIAMIKGFGILGDKYVDITMGMPTEIELSDGQFINVAPSFSIERGVKNLEDKVTGTLKNVDSVLSEFKKVTLKINSGEGTVGKLISSSSLYDNLNSLSGKFNKISDAVIERKGTLGKTIYDDELYNNLQYTLVNIKSISEDLKTGKGTIGKLLTTDSVYYDLKSISGKVDTLMSNLNGNTNVGKFLNDDEMYRKLLITIKEFNDLLSDIKKNPGRYINLSIF